MAALDPSARSQHWSSRPASSDLEGDKDVSTFESQPDVDPAEERKLLIKLDLCVIPIILFLYLLSFLDRTNIGNAASAGMTKDLKLPADGLSDVHHLRNPYVNFIPEIPPKSPLAFGLITTFSAFMTNYGGLITQRLLLGACEAALFPCLIIYLTLFYQRHELAQRTSYFFISSAISGAFGGLLAFGLLKVRAGHPGWFWLYLVEGIVTVVAGIASWFLLADDPQTAWFLNAREKEIVAIRAARTAVHDTSKIVDKRQIIEALTDPKIYLNGLTQFGCIVSLYGFSTFLPVIIKGFGYGTARTQLLCIPVFVWGAIPYMILARISDKTGRRLPIVIPAILVSITGYSILLGVSPKQLGVRYFALFLCITGIYTSIGLNITWLQVNIAGFQKRSTAIGMQQSIANVGGIVAGQVYRTAGSPLYRLGHAFTLGCFIFAIIGFCVQALYLRHLNQVKAKLTEEEIKQWYASGRTGDKAPDFKYLTW